MHKLRPIAIAFLLAFVSSVSYAEDGGCKTLLFKQLNHLPHMEESYPFRIWYATEGENALQTPESTIDDLLLQLHSADKYYYKELGLTPPLLQPRYKQAEYIEVYLLSMDKGNGLAFDEVIASKRTKKATAYSCGIKMHLNRDLQPSRNVTPAHELFHLYQYANSMFKARWYLEGMARWVEQAFRGESAKERKAVAPNSCAEVHNESYGASRYWRDLARRKNADDIMIEADDLDLSYSDGRAVFSAEVFKNGAAIKDIFDALKEESAAQSKELNLPLYKWPEKTQRSAQFNNNICNIIE